MSFEEWKIGFAVDVDTWPYFPHVWIIVMYPLFVASKVSVHAVGKYRASTQWDCASFSLSSHLQVIRSQQRDKHKTNTDIHDDWDSSPEQRNWEADTRPPQPLRRSITIQCKKPFRFCGSSNRSYISYRLSMFLGFNSDSTPFPCLRIIPHKYERLVMALQVTSNDIASSF